RRHTISYGDWSSDVCSSDLAVRHIQRRGPLHASAGHDAGVDRHEHGETSERIGQRGDGGGERERNGSNDSHAVNTENDSIALVRSEERRVGKGGRFLWA